MKRSLVRNTQQAQLTIVLAGVFLFAALIIFAWWHFMLTGPVLSFIVVAGLGCVVLVYRTSQRACQELQVLIEQRNQVLGHLPWGYLVADGTGTCVEINEKGAALFGSKKEEMVGQTLTTDRFPVTLKALSNQTAIEAESVIQKDNETIVIYCSAFPIKLSSGKIGVMTCFADVSEQKALEAKIHQMDRLSMVGEMVSIITHDIRNPLASIKGLAQLGELTPDQAEQLGLYRRINALVNDINQYLERILCYSRPDRGEAGSNCSVRFLFESILLMLQGKFTSTGINLEIEVQEPGPKLTINRLELQHVLLNLVNNAFEAMSSAEHKGVITLRSWSEGKQAIIEVSDQGPGIPKDALPRIWNMFYTTKPDGNGIGLAMVKRSIEQHQGTISVTSSPEGTTFTIRLPVNEVDDVSA